MAHPSEARLIPECRVSVDGKKLDVATDATLTRVEVDLDVDLFGQCVLVFHDPAQKLINGARFRSGSAVKVEIGFASGLGRVFEGEVVALEPQFRRDLPPALRVVCQEALHRLALSQRTRAFNNVDDAEIAKKIAREHGLSAQAPSGSKEHVLQANVTDAVFLRRLAQKHGNHLRIEGKKLILGPPPKRPSLTIGPGDGARKVKVRIQSNTQVGEVSVHGYDPKTKREVVGTARPQGETGEGARNYGRGKKLSFAGHEHQPADTATAEAMARGRMRKLAEGHVVATVEAIGDPGYLPGATVKLEKLGAEIDGSYRIEKALHNFSKHGYYATLRAVRVARAQPPPPLRPAPAVPARAPAAAPPREAEAPAPGKNGPQNTKDKAPPPEKGVAPKSGAPEQASAAESSVVFHWEPPQGACGQTVRLRGETKGLADGTVLEVKLVAKQGASPHLAPLQATVRNNRIDAEFAIANVDFGEPGRALPRVQIEATTKGAANVKSQNELTVRARGDGPERAFDERRTWNGLSGHPRT